MKVLISVSLSFMYYLLIDKDSIIPFYSFPEQESRLIERVASPCAGNSNELSLPAFYVY